MAETVDRAENDLKRVNGYRIGRALGSGSHGMVFEVRPPPVPRRTRHASPHVDGRRCRSARLQGTGADGLRVAIKVISGSVTRRGALLRHGMLSGLADLDRREIAVMKNLTHPHCVQLFEVIDDPDNARTFLIME